MEGNLASTGVPGLDTVLRGGLPRNHIYLIDGDPGAGKTTLALQFLLAGCGAGERCLYVTLSETARELGDVAASHGWDLGGITVQELERSATGLDGDGAYTVFHPSEVELADTSKRLMSHVESADPARVVLDSLSELRLLASDPLRYRRQILALKQFLTGRNCTVLLLDDRSVQPEDLQPHSIVHGVIELDRVSAHYGGERRRLRVNKLRGLSFTGGYHDAVIRTGGVEVFPRLLTDLPERSPPQQGPASTGLAELDSLLGGGLDRGTTTLITGPAGTGKSSLATQIVAAAAERGETSAVFGFEDSLEIINRRALALGVPYADHIATRRILFRHLDPAEVSPGEFAALMRDSVDRRGAGVVVIDSLNGYLNAMPEERFLTAQLHELATFLNARGIVTVLVLAQQGIFTAGSASPVDISYLADAVVLIRHFEAEGAVRKALSVVKKRTGFHENTIRELRFDRQGLRVGDAISQFHGVLGGNPIFIGHRSQLIEGSQPSADA